ALMAVSGYPEMQMVVLEGQRNALIYKEELPRGKARWGIYGVLRGWLGGSERVSEEDKAEAHHAGGNFLYTVVEDNKEEEIREELGIPSSECLMEVRLQCLEASKYSLATRSDPLTQEESLATSINNLASQFRDRGKYTDAEPLLVQALAIR